MPISLVREEIDKLRTRANELQNASEDYIFGVLLDIMDEAFAKGYAQAEEDYDVVKEA